MKFLLIQYPKNIYYPIDVALIDNNSRIEVDSKDINKYNLKIGDIGKNTIRLYSEIISKSDVVILNGPAGIIEDINFSVGTERIIHASIHPKYSIVGGGHILSEVNKLKYNKYFSHISSGGGSCMEYLACRKLPGLESLKYSYEKYNKNIN